MAMLIFFHAISSILFYSTYPYRLSCASNPSPNIGSPSSNRPISSANTLISTNTIQKWTRKFPFEKPQHVWTFSVDTPERHLPLDFPVVHDSYQITPVQIVASVHGLICLQQGTRVCLWNPVTKHCTNLPPLPVLTSRCGFGFGFDPKAADYKVVTVNLMTIEHCVSDYVFHIYSLSSDSWRKFQGFTLPDMIVYDRKTLYRETIFCWLASFAPDVADAVQGPKDYQVVAYHESLVSIQ